MLVSMDLSERTIPPLREGVSLEEAEPEARLPFMACDTVLGQKIRLDQRGMAIALALTQPWPPPMLLGALEQGLGLRLSPALLVRFIRFLDSHYLLDTERAARQVEAVRTLPPSSEKTIRFIPGTSHDCVACGAACTSHDIGPVATEQVAHVRTHFPQAPGTFVDRYTSSEDSAGLYCSMKDDACSFLLPNRLCSIHSELSAAHKPTDCRVFPLAFVETGDEILVGVKAECRSYIASKRNGGALNERMDELHQLLGSLSSMPQIPSVIHLEDNLTLPYSVYVSRIESPILQTLRSSHTSEWDELVALNRRADQLIGDVREFDHAGWVFPPAQEPQEVPSYQPLLTQLAVSCRETAALNAEAGNNKRDACFRRVAGYIERLRDEKVQATDLSPDERELLHDHLEQSLFLKGPLQGPHFRFGLACLNLTVLLARSGADEEGLNHALADVLKALRARPIERTLEGKSLEVTTIFQEHLSDWIPDQSLNG